MAELDDGASRFFGVVLFDDPMEPGAGWCCRYRPETYKRITNPSELPTDTVWWTNVDNNVFFGRSEIWRQPTLRDDGYLITTMPAVLKEWGFDPKSLGKEFTCRFLAQAFDRLMQLAWSIVREVKPKARMSDVIVSRSLRDDLRICLPDLEYPKGEAASVMKAGLAYEQFTSTGAKSPRGSKSITIRRPRIDYALEMLQTPVPKGPYEFLDRKALRSLSGDPVRLVLDANEPMMVDVSVTIQPEVASIYGFGASTDRNKRLPRSWVAHPEFIALTRIADIQVRGLWKAGEYWGMLQDFPEPVATLLQSPFSTFSWSAGVLAETIWRTALLGEDKGKGRSDPKEDRAGSSWQGIWMRAADKTSMFMASLRLAELGHCVNSYGNGWVRCWVPEEETEGFLRDGLSLGFLPTLQSVPDGMFSKGRVPWGGANGLERLATLVMRKNFDFLWNMDVIPMLSTEEKRVAAMRKIQEMARSKAAA